MAKGIDISKINRPGTAGSQNGNRLANLLTKEITLGKAGFSDKKKESFYHELSILLSAGVDIKTAFELIESEQKTDADKELVNRLLVSIVNGDTFSMAMERERAFSMYERVSVQIGEETGKLVVVLNQLATYFNNKISQKRQIVSSLSYPGIVLMTSLGAIFFMLNFVVPMFSDIFKRFGGKLPAITQFIIDTASFFKSYGILIIGSLLVVVFLLYRQRDQEWFRRMFSHVLLKVPFAGDLIQKIYLIRFCTSMNLLISSKVPILTSIQLIRKMINYYPIEASLAQIEKDILIGIPLHASLAKFDIYPRKMIYLIKVGEEVNQLDHFFEKTAVQYNEEVKYLTSVMGSLVEPFMIVFLGLVVGFILIAMYLPLFQLSSSF